MTWPRKVKSTAPTKEPVTVSGWYECTDGTWAYFRGATVLADWPTHYDRPPTPEEIEASYERASEEQFAALRARVEAEPQR